jgi:hypothetical protein
VRSAAQLGLSAWPALFLLYAYAGFIGLDFGLPNPGAAFAQIDRQLLGGHPAVLVAQVLGLALTTVAAQRAAGVLAKILSRSRPEERNA